MNPRVKSVKPLENFILHLTFKNGEEKLFDVKPWLEKKIYKPLSNAELFNKAYVLYGTVSWNEEVDFCPDILYLESTALKVVH